MGGVTFRKQEINDSNGNLYKRHLTKIENETTNMIYTQEYTYFSSGVVKSEKITLENGEQLLYTYEYDNEDRLSAIYLNNSLQETFSYNANGWLIDDQSFAAGVRFRYTYNDYGNITVRYAYFLQNDGSWLHVGTHTHSYNSVKRDQIMTAYNDSYSYDDSGNPLNYYQHSVLTWDGNELATYSKDSVTASYSYQNGLRTEKIVGNYKYVYSWQDDRLVSQIKYNNSGEEIEKLVFWYDQNNELTGFVYNDSEVYSYIRNYLGDIKHILNANGEIIVTYYYLGNGRIYTMTDTSTNGIGSINPFRYRGYYYDEESKFYYLQSRYYCSDLMRFLSPDAPEYLNHDTFSTNLPLNMYAYCENDPVQNVDVDGKCYYNKNGVWCHDNWEYINGYKMKKSPGINKYLFTKSFKLYIPNGGIMTFPKGKGIISSYGNTELYTKNVVFMPYIQTKQLYEVLSNQFYVGKIKDWLKGKLTKKAEEEFFKYLIKKGFKKLAALFNSVSVISSAVSILNDFISVADIFILKSYVNRKHGCYVYSILCNDPRTVPSIGLYYEWKSLYTYNPTKSDYYIKKF